MKTSQEFWFCFPKYQILSYKLTQFFKTSFYGNVKKKYKVKELKEPLCFNSYQYLMFLFHLFSPLFYLLFGICLKISHILPINTIVHLVFNIFEYSQFLHHTQFNFQTFSILVYVREGNSYCLSGEKSDLLHMSWLFLSSFVTYIAFLDLLKKVLKVSKYW